MGKVKRLRQKLHIAAKKEKQEPKSPSTNLPDLVLSLPNDNLFAGLDIDLTKLNTKLNDDVQSIKSFKSVKTKASGKTVLLKKEKLKIRRAILLKKIDAIHQMKKDLKIRDKRKATAIMGDTNPLHDALPSLESLLKNRSNIRQHNTELLKKKGIEKARKRKKELVQGVKLFKTVLNNKTFKKNPLEAITQHVQALVSQEKETVRK